MTGAQRPRITLATEWAYRRVYLTNAERTTALATWLEHYNNTERHHSAVGAAPITRLSPT